MGVADLRLFIWLSREGACDLQQLNRFARITFSYSKLFVPSLRTGLVLKGHPFLCSGECV